MFILGPVVLLVMILTASGTIVVGNSLDKKAKEAKRAPDTTIVSEDQVFASFERELNHQTKKERPAKGEAITNDVLYAEVNSTLWTPEEDVKIDQNGKPTILDASK